MEAQGHTQSSLAKKAGVVQRTLGNYLNPKERELGAKGKEPSAKLTEMAMVAEALGIEPWELLIPYVATTDAETEKLAVELDALFRALPKGAQAALIESARLVSRATKPEGHLEETTRSKPATREEEKQTH